MEYCSGGSISDIMAATDAPLDEDLIAFVCGETLKGLAYLHTMGKARLRAQTLFTIQLMPGFRRKRSYRKYASSHQRLKQIRNMGLG